MIRSDNSPTRATTASMSSDNAQNRSSGPAGRPDVQIRRARLEDEPHIRAFTQNIFEWGDYVADAFAEWLEIGNDVYVAEVNGIPVGVTCAAYPAEGEAWFQGIRVKAELRRMGIASMLTEASIAGAKERGARVCRAHIDSDNYRSQRLAKNMGFHLAARIAEFTVSVAGGAAASTDGQLPVPNSRNGLASMDERVPAHKPRNEPASTNGHAPGGESGNGLGSADGPALEPIEVTRATPEEAGLLFEAASKEIRYLECEYTWVSLTRQNLVQASTEESLLVARDGSGRTLAGGLMCNPYVEDHIHTGEGDNDGGERPHAGDEEAYLCAAVGSLFGTIEGVVAIIRHALELVRTEGAERNIPPGELFVAVESEHPVVRELLSRARQAGLDMQVHGETHLWELRLTE